MFYVNMNKKRKLRKHLVAKKIDIFFLRVCGVPVVTVTQFALKYKKKKLRSSNSIE